jgi:hypothetical protein
MDLVFPFHIQFLKCMSSKESFKWRAGRAWLIAYLTSLFCRTLFCLTEAEIPFNQNSGRTGHMTFEMAKLMKSVGA